MSYSYLISATPEKVAPKLHSLLRKTIALNRIRWVKRSIHSVAYAVAHIVAQLPIVLLIYVAIDDSVKATIDIQSCVEGLSLADPRLTLVFYIRAYFERLMAG